MHKLVRSLPVSRNVGRKALAADEGEDTATDWQARFRVIRREFGSTPTPYEWVLEAELDIIPLQVRVCVFRWLVNPRTNEAKSVFLWRIA